VYRRALEREVRTSCVALIEAAPAPWHHDWRAPRAARRLNEGNSPKLLNRMPPPPQRRNCADLDRRLGGTASIGLVEDLAGATQSAPANDGTPVTAEAARGFSDRLAATTGRRGSKGFLVAALRIGGSAAGIRRSNYN